MAVEHEGLGRARHAQVDPGPPVRVVARQHVGVAVLRQPGVGSKGGALDVRASGITENMKLAAADAIANVVGDDLTEECVIPSVFDERVGPAVATAVALAAQKDGVARR